MNNREMLLANVLAHPDSDSPRLEMADWLSEQGENDRADFIRVQCAAADCWAGHDGKDELPAPLQHRYAALVEAGRELLGFMIDDPEGYKVSNKIRWARDVLLAANGTLAEYPGFRRGFVEEVTCSWDGFRTHAAAIRAATPLRHVNLTDTPGFEPGPGGGARLDGCTVFHPVSKLVIRGGPEAFLKSLLEAEYEGLTFKLPSRQVTTPHSIVQETTSNLGRISSQPYYLEAIRRSPVLSRLIHRDRTAQYSGATANGLPWLNWTVNYSISRRDLVMAREPMLIVDLIASRRQRAVGQLLELIEAEFRRLHPDANPDEWRLAVLRGWWMRETAVENLPRRTTDAHIDCTGQFERLPVRRN